MFQPTNVTATKPPTEGVYVTNTPILHVQIRNSHDKYNHRNMDIIVSMMLQYCLLKFTDIPLFTLRTVLDPEESSPCIVCWRAVLCCAGRYVSSAPSHTGQFVCVTTYIYIYIISKNGSLTGLVTSYVETAF